MHTVGSILGETMRLPLIPKAEFELAKRHGAAETIDGVPHLLYLDETTGGTVWGPVRIEG
jgi:hypothetical protein